MLAQILEEGRARRDADRVDEEGEADLLDDAHVLPRGLGDRGGEDEPDEEGAGRSEAQGPEADRAERRPQAHHEEQSEEGVRLEQGGHGPRLPIPRIGAVSQ